MPRSLSAADKRAMFAQGTDQVYLRLLTIDSDEMAEPIRVCDNSKAIESRSNTFLAFPFQVTLPTEDADQLPSVSLKVDNVDRQIVEAVRTINDPPTVTLEVIRAEAPDTVVAGPYTFTLRDVEYDALTVEGQLSFENMTNQPYPEGMITPGDFPAVF